MSRNSRRRKRYNEEEDSVNRHAHAVITNSKESSWRCSRTFSLVLMVVVATALVGIVFQASVLETTTATSPHVLQSQLEAKHPEETKKDETSTIATTNVDGSFRQKLIFYKQLPPIVTGYDDKLNYGGIDYHNATERQIAPNDDEAYKLYKQTTLRRMERRALSRDTAPSLDHTDEIDEPRKCRPVSFSQNQFLTSNHFHEIDLSRFDPEWQIQSLRGGNFRSAWIVERPHLNESFVLKVLLFRKDVGAHNFRLNQVEAIVMERLSSSPRIVDIYGYCGNSILAETMPGEMASDLLPGTGKASQAELDRLPDVQPRNNYTTIEKLEMALFMSQALADLHGYEEGVMLQGDTHPNQFLKSRGGTVKLNDFNTGAILDFDRTSRRYCPMFRGF